MDQKIDYKVTFIGPSGAGKTKIMVRYRGNCFNEIPSNDIGAAYSIIKYPIEGNLLTIQYVSDKQVEIGGVQSFTNMMQIYITNVDAVVLVYDRSNYESFDSIKRYYDEVKAQSGNAFIMMIGNKSDLPPGIRQEEVYEYVTRNKLLHLETSAKIGVGVTEAFDALKKQLIRSPN